MANLDRIFRTLILGAGVAVAGCGGGDPEQSSPEALGADGVPRAHSLAAGTPGGGSTGPNACVNPSRVALIGGNHGSWDYWSRDLHCVGWTKHEFRFADLPANTFYRRIDFHHRVDLSHLSSATGQSRCQANRVEYALHRLVTFNGASRWQVVESGLLAPLWDASASRCVTAGIWNEYPASESTVVQERLWVRSLPSDGNYGHLFTAGMANGVK